MKRLILLIVSVVVACFSAFSHDFMFKHLEVKDGMPSNQINAIYKDSRGFMWFGTAAGLARYDGYRFKVFRSTDNGSASLPDNYIEKIVEDSYGYGREKTDMSFITGIRRALSVMFVPGCGI